MTRGSQPVRILSLHRPSERNDFLKRVAMAGWALAGARKTPS